MPHVSRPGGGFEAEEWVSSITPSVLYQTAGFNIDTERSDDPDIDGTTRYTDDIDLTSSPVAFIDFKIDPSDATDDVTLYLFNRIDADWDGTEIPWKATPVTINNTGDVRIKHYTIPKEFGPGHYRFSMVRSGSTTTFDMVVTCKTARLAQARRPTLT